MNSTRGQKMKEKPAMVYSLKHFTICNNPTILLKEDLSPTYFLLFWEIIKGRGRVRERSVMHYSPHIHLNKCQVSVLKQKKWNKSLIHFRLLFIFIPPANVKNRWCSHILRGYRNRTLAWNGLNKKDIFCTAPPKSCSTL